MFYIAVLVGCFIYLLLQLNGAYILPDFKWGLFFKTNWIPTVLNLVIGSVFVFMKAEIADIYPITFMSSLMLGIGGQALIKKLSNAFDSKINTAIGV